MPLVLIAVSTPQQWSKWNNIYNYRQEKAGRLLLTTTRYLFLLIFQRDKKSSFSNLITLIYQNRERAEGYSRWSKNDGAEDALFAGARTIVRGVVGKESSKAEGNKSTEASWVQECARTL